MASRSKSVGNATPGPLVLIGGAENWGAGRRSVILERFVQISGGSRARLVVLPMASALKSTGERYAGMFTALGVRSVRILETASRREANRQSVADLLEQGTGIFFTGGEQCRLAEGVLGTRLERAIRAAHARGVTVGGTSAGASFLSAHMIRFGRSGSVPRTGMVDLAPGLGLTSRFIIDQHFGRRNRTGRLLTALALCPDAMGLGLGEDTAAFVGEDSLEVVGEGTVVLIDPSRAKTGFGRPPGRHVSIGITDLTFHFLVHGAAFQLPSRTATLPNGIAPETLAMKIEEASTYAGPNVWAYFPVIRLRLDLGDLEQWPSGRLGRQFQEALLAALPGLRAHRCSYGVAGGFVRRLTDGEGTWLGHVLEHVAIELQNMVGSAVSFGRAREVKGRCGVYDVVYEFRDREVGHAAGQFAFRLLQSLLPRALRGTAPASAFDFTVEFAGFRSLAERHRLGPSTAALVQAAERRRIPWERIDDDHLIQFGTGSRQRRIEASITSETPYLSVSIAQDKILTNRVLGTLGIPVPAQLRVHDVTEAVSAAKRLGFPVVIKPVDGNQGRGVRPNVWSVEEVQDAYGTAQCEGARVLVEKHIDGLDHRLLVVDGRLIAAARRIPGHVVGDGSSTVGQLVERLNQDPRRGDGHENVLTRLELDEEADWMLKRAGYCRDSVPDRGIRVWLRAAANLSRGSTAVDVTEDVHPDNRLLAVRAARALGLDLAGVDFITPDISRSHLEVGGAVTEVNAAPGLRMHLAPSEGAARPVADRILAHLFPRGRPSTVPIAAITGTNGKTTTARMVAHVAAKTARRVGLTTTNGVYIDGELISAGDTTGPASARMVLNDPAVDLAVLETARGGMLREGLAFRHCSVGAVLNVTADHLGIGGIDTPEELAVVKRMVVEVATDVAVLNADDPLCMAMVEHAGARRICLVTMDSGNPLVGRHLAGGGMAVVFDDSEEPALIACQGAARRQLIRVQDIPATVNGKVRFNIQNAAFAAAIALGMGLGARTVHAGLSTFAASLKQTPGRVNIYDGHPFRVVVDYGHNPAAVNAMCRAAVELGEDGGRICVIAAPGDRRDEDIREVARAAAGLFDLYICRRDDSLRGRGPDDVPQLLREGFLSAGVPEERIRVVPSEAEAIMAGLRAARPGDLLLLFADDLKRTWDQVVGFRPAMRPRAAVSMQPAAGDAYLVRPPS